MNTMKDNLLIKRLVCPCCKSGMDVSEDGHILFCKGERKHCFDFSAKGYVNLSMNRAFGGDSKEAVRSRTDFLNKDYYLPIAKKLVSIIADHKKDGFVIDAGCGEGYYTEKVLRAGYDVMGVDLSKFAVDSLASRIRPKKDIHAFAAVASIFELPIVAGSVDVVLSIFAPCAEDETIRALSDDGILIIVSAGKEHLMGLKRAIYDNAYENDGRADMPKGMKLVDKQSLTYSVSINGNDDVMNLFSMTPYYWRTSPQDVEKLKGIEMLETVVDVDFSIYKK